ncbi:MAG: adenylate kinase [Kibdelosporangium sp.]
MHRVLVAGSTGSGKTTMARELSARYGLPRFELDALYHGPGWVKRPEFEADVKEFSTLPAWVTEDQYHRLLGDTLWRRADTVVWLDMPLHVVMSRVLRRSVGRAITRKELWNGNRERWREWLQPDHPIRWAWSEYDRKRAQVLEYAGKHPHVNLIHLTAAVRPRRLFG